MQFGLALSIGELGASPNSRAAHRKEKKMSCNLWYLYWMLTKDDQEPQVPTHEVASRRGWQIWLDYHSVIKAVDDRKVNALVAARAKRVLDELRCAQKADLKAKTRVAPFWAKLLVVSAIILSILPSAMLTALICAIIDFVFSALVSPFAGYDIYTFICAVLLFFAVFFAINIEFVDPLTEMALSRLLDDRIRRLEQAMAKMPRNLITG